MNKQEFLEKLCAELSALPTAEQDKACAFYDEIIDDSVDDGLTEEEAIDKLGTMEEIIDRIVDDTMQLDLPTERSRRKPRSKTVWLLLILGFPLWFPLLISVLAALFSLLIAVFAGILALWSSLAAFGAVVVGGVIGLMMHPQMSVRLLWLGSAMIGAGAGVLMYPVCLWTTKQLLRAARFLWNKGIKAVTRKGDLTYEIAQ